MSLGTIIGMEESGGDNFVSLQTATLFVQINIDPVSQNCVSSAVNPRETASVLWSIHTRDF